MNTSLQPSPDLERNMFSWNGLSIEVMGGFGAGSFTGVISFVARFCALDTSSRTLPYREIEG